VRIVVTGAHGTLGSDICDSMAEHFETTAFDLDDFDVSDLEPTRARISLNNPDLIVHCAAYTDVDRAEEDSEHAFRVNATGTKNVALVSDELSIPMVYISTDYVFNGAKRSPYLEGDRPDPLSVYGKSKLAGEKWVKRLLHNFFIVRTSCLFGKEGDTFIRKILRKADAESSARGEISVVDDQLLSPTYTLDLAKALLILIQSQSYGIYHITNSGHCSWFQLARTVFDCLGIETKLLPVGLDSYSQAARRPRFSVLDNSLFEKNFGVRLRHWEEALKEFLHALDQ
jgi:dTDP-4-dehydrorhamnose reductase